MAMKMSSAGLEEVNKMLGQLQRGAPEIAAKALYVGAGVVADAVTAGLRSIESEQFKYAAGNSKRLASNEQKAAIQGATAIRKFEKNGLEVSTKVAISGGYADVNGKQKSVTMIANSINSGTSFMKKQPFFRKAVRQSTPTATAAIKSAAEELIKKETR